MRITQGTQKDSKAISEIASATFIKTFCELNPDKVELHQAYARKTFTEEKISQEMGRAGVAYYLMKEGDALLGYAKTVKDIEKKIEIEKLYIAYDLIRKGLGSKFFEHILLQAKHEGTKKLWLNVNAQNPRAIRFFEKCGFKKIEDNQDNDWIMEVDVVLEKAKARSKTKSS